MNLEQDVEYIVTKPSNDGTFLLGDKIVLKADGRIWIGNDFVEPVDVAAAVEGMECDTFVLTSRIPSTIAILQAIYDNIDSTCHECESRVAKDLAQELLAEIRDQLLIPRCGMDDGTIERLILAAPEMFKLLYKIRVHIDSTCHECESKAIVPEIDAMIDKIEGGGK